MTYFSLRKTDPEPEPEQALEQGEHDEHEPEQPEEEQPTEAPPTSWGGAILAGLRGPGGWLTAHLGAGPAWGVHVIAGWACLYYGGWVTVGVVAAWLLAVGAFIPREFLERLAAAVERRDKERQTPAPAEARESPSSTPEQVYAATLEWIWGQVGNRNGVHLSELLAHAHAHGLHTDLDVPAFRGVLEEWGFPIRQQLKVGGKNRPGIHRDDLPQQPAQAPSPEETAPAATAVAYLA